MSQKFFLILHAIALASIFGVIIGLANLNDKIDNLAQEMGLVSSANNTIAPQAQISDNGKIAPVEAPREKGEAIIEITDNGYFPAELKISANNITTITIKNSAQSIYSFAIDELNINIEAIAPGEEAGMVIAQEFTESKNYTFHSISQGDDPQTFTGTLMVLK